MTETTCHPDCALGGADHPGYLEYRCIDDQGRPLPFPMTHPHVVMVLGARVVEIEEI